MQSDRDGEETTEVDPATPLTGGKAQWNPSEVSAFVNYLHKHCAEQGDAGNFKSSVYAAAATSSHSISGPPKTGVMCKNKWAALKKVYNSIKIYAHRSGMHWDSQYGTNMVGPDAATVWDDHVGKKGNDILKPFHNRGWEHYEWIQEIFPLGVTVGGGTTSFSLPSPPLS